MTLGKTDNTGFVSIQTEALIECQILSPEKLDDALEAFEHRSGSIGLSSELEYHWEEFSPSLRKIRSQSPEIATWIKFQQRAMVELASQLNSQRAMLSEAQPQNVSICASGVEFASNLPCSTGDNLEIILSLGRGMPTILLIGVINHISASDAADAADATEYTQNILQVEFSHIREPDQEILIRHIHRAQLNQIRSARTEKQKTGKAL